jgi:hypothetical protein
MPDRRPDRRPDRIVAGERETLLGLLQFQRDSFVRKVTGVDEQTARISPVASGTTLLWLTLHVAFAEQVWVVRNFAGREMLPAPDEATCTLADALAHYALVRALVDEIVVAEPSLDAVCASTPDGVPANLRWVLMHLLEEIARHAGHADILRELIDGETGR